MPHRSAEHPAVITDVPLSQDEEFAKRRKRNTILMSLRALCVIAAALVYGHSVVLALAFIVGGAVLPWCAVLIANDRLPKKRRTRPEYVGRPDAQALPAASDGGFNRTIEGPPDWQER